MNKLKLTFVKVDGDRLLYKDNGVWDVVNKKRDRVYYYFRRSSPCKFWLHKEGEPNVSIDINQIASCDIPSGSSEIELEFHSFMENYPYAD